MISVKNRTPANPNRIQLVPISGNIYTWSRADNPTEVGTPWNRSTAQLMQADIRTLPIASGQTIAAKDIVNVVGGQITKAGTPNQAIALQAGTAGQSISVIFDGVAELSGITSGTTITSLGGVHGYAPSDGWLWVSPWWAGTHAIKLMETVTTSAAAQVDLDVSTLQLSKYKSIRVVYSGAVSVANRAINITANNDSGSKYWSGSGAVSGTTSLGVTAGLSSDRGSFLTLEFDDHPYGMSGRITGGGGQSTTEMSLKSDSLFCSVCRLSALTKLSFTGSACDLVSGSKFEIYGIA